MIKLTKNWGNMHEKLSQNINNPFELFAKWFEMAKNNSKITEPTAMSLATCANDSPSVRIVLLKEYDERGFVFYSNAQSQKGCEIAQNPNVALCFYWMELELQVRIVGEVEEVSAAQADAYFASRTRERQIGAWASLQSRSMQDRSEFEQRIAEFEAKYAGIAVPRPQHWKGWRVLPQRFEFWQQGEHRLHDRVIFTRNNAGQWQKSLLYP